MDRHSRQRIARQNVPATWGRRRAVRLSPEIYASDIPVHFTICADAGRPFESVAVAPMVIGAVERAMELRAHRLYVYCLMPDHLHVLVSAGDSGISVEQSIDRFKSITTNCAWKLGLSGILWQASARDRVMRSGERLDTLVRYISDNPVRAGLVSCWMDWPYTKVFVEI